MPQNFSEKNGQWKGNEASFQAIHIWIKARKPKPQHCENCKKTQPIDLANISQEYYRDIEDFEWLCRKCHMTKDGRLKKFTSIVHLKKPPTICLKCGILTKNKGKGLCRLCYERQRKKRGVIKICLECGKKFLADPRPHHKRCSKRCMLNSKSWRKARSENAKKYIGEKNPNWKGGKYQKLKA